MAYSSFVLVLDILITPPYYNTTQPLAKAANMHELDQVTALQAHFP
jgi:hypothetical protein